MIIDSLTHVTPDGRWFNTAYDASEDRLLREMDAAHVDRAVVVALAEFISNEFVLEACNRHSERLLPGASFNPAAHRDAATAAGVFRSELRDSPFCVLKLHPRLNRYDPLDPRCLALLEEMASWTTPIPVWLDSLLYCKGVALRKPIVDTIHDIVSRFPALQFVILHSCGTWALHLAEAVRDCPNAMLDFSFTFFRYADTSMAVDFRHLLHTFDRRMVFGSDFPEISVEAAMRLFRRLAESVSDERCNNVLGNNLSGLLTARVPHGAD
ncbi:MAG: amidohydrolase family protein [Pirellulales bacterium]